MSKSTCSIEGCPTVAKSLGLCIRHYFQKRRGVLGVTVDRQAKMEARFWAKVEKGPGCWEWTASKITGHGRMVIDGATAYAHRISYELANGPIPDGLLIDHICHNKGCVNPDHLRLATQKQNGENRAGLPANNTSGVRGVHWRKDVGCWQAVVRSTPKVYHVGYFDDLAEAEAAAIAKRNELFTHNDIDRRAA